jgi:hypothetical protein
MTIAVKHKTNETQPAKPSTTVARPAGSVNSVIPALIFIPLVIVAVVADAQGLQARLHDVILPTDRQRTPTSVPLAAYGSRIIYEAFV